MNKIDFHIHTIPTMSDANFTFSAAALKEYVTVANLDAIAITNHNMFDTAQYQEIRSSLDIVVFPGIEVNLQTGHVLIISDESNLDEFENCAATIETKIQKIGDKLSIDEVEVIFGDLSRLLVIPHYEKKPAVWGDELEQVLGYAEAGEVDSAKKFIRVVRDEGRVTPVLFSDIRVREGMSVFPTRQTYIDCGEITIGSLKKCLEDKTKVALSKDDGNKLFEVFGNGQQISTGLNILLGERSSGKTHTLDRINDSIERAKYIRQFSLVQKEDAEYEREFSNDIKKKRSRFAEEYLGEFKSVLNDVFGIDLRANEAQVKSYIDSLLKSATEAERKDSFSKSALFDESLYSLKEDKVLGDLIGSVRQLIENVEYRKVIEKHVELQSLRKLALELIEIFWEKEADRSKKTIVNAIVKDIKQRLRRRTSATQIDDVDLYHIKLDQVRVARFEEIVERLQLEEQISKEDFQGFSVVTSKSPFTGAGQIKAVSGQKVAFSECYNEYSTPYKYLRALVANEALIPSEFYKYFVKINYKILNKEGSEVSGGERSEFRLLQEIKDAQKFDILLIDEPESSFDNVFLKSNVNQMIKEMSAVMPVVVVTHNSTVGASIDADYLLYARKVNTENEIVYSLFSGHPTDSLLRSVDGQQIDNYDATLDALEAGKVTYIERGRMYEAIKN